MKIKTILSTLVLAIVTTGSLCAQQVSECNEERVIKENFTYIKLGAAAIRMRDFVDFGPAIGIGRRFGHGSSAIDISVNWAGENDLHYFSLPKIMYLRQFSPYSTSSFYLGAGLSYGSMGEHRYQFSGLIGEAAIGYEMFRDQNIRTFVELDVSYGLLPFKSKYNCRDNMPAVALTFGVGF